MATSTCLGVWETLSTKKTKIYRRKNKKLFREAIDINSSAIKSMREISIQFEIYLCITIFSREKDNYFNKALIINPNGEIVQKYNKKNIPSEKCYQEKYYFNQPKNSFKFFDILFFN